MPETSTQVKQIRYLGDKKVPLKELRKEFYKIRKFEIQNLWQRSIFLITFIVILITGYTNLIEKLLLERDKWLTNSDFSDIYIHVICCILAILGLGLTGYGYYLAQTIQNPIKAITMFFVAVLAAFIYAADTIISWLFFDVLLNRKG